MLGKWYFKVAGDIHFYLARLFFMLIAISSVSMTTDGQGPEQRRRKRNTHPLGACKLGS